MLNENKFFNELKEFEELTSKVTVEKDGTIIVSKEIKSTEERVSIVKKTKQLFAIFKGNNNASSV